MNPRYSHVNPNDGARLQTLPAGSSRIRSWLSRSVWRPGFPLEREVQITGAISIVTGLEYHHGQFMNRVQALEPLTARLQAPLSGVSAAERLPTAQEFSTLAALDHEAVAYLNRVGQLHFFARALDREAQLPAAAALLPFRHKHTAHRSVDKPRSESADDLQQQAMAFGFGHAFEGGFPVFKVRTDATWTTFHMRVDHPALIREAGELFEAIFPLPDDA